MVLNFHGGSVYATNAFRVPECSQGTRRGRQSGTNHSWRGKFKQYLEPSVLTKQGNFINELTLAKDKPARQKILADHLRLLAFFYIRGIVRRSGQLRTETAFARNIIDKTAAVSFFALGTRKTSKYIGLSTSDAVVVTRNAYIVSFLDIEREQW